MRVLSGLALAAALAVVACDSPDSVTAATGADRVASRAASEGVGDAGGEVVFDLRSASGNVLTGEAGALRGLNAGGFPWILQGARARLTRDGRLRVEVRGLVLADAPNPALIGTNPVPQFRAILSCQVESSGGYTIVNVPTTTFDASTSGDARIDAPIEVPPRCLAPAVFVTSPSNQWFAVTG